MLLINRTKPTFVYTSVYGIAVLQTWKSVITLFYVPFTMNLTTTTFLVWHYKVKNVSRSRKDTKDINKTEVKI